MRDGATMNEKAQAWLGNLLGWGQRRQATDAEIAAQLAEGWSLDRLARIELSLLRCGAYELRSMPHIPARAAVSEYAALSDACGCDVGFVNAVLDRMAYDARIVEMGK